MNEPSVILKHAREPHQLQAMERIAEADYCPFCWENLQKEHDRPILWQGEAWLITENFAPYDHTASHLLLIAKRHILFPWELIGHEWLELGKANQWYGTIYAPAGGALCMRFGSADHSASSVQHLHAHLVVPDLEAVDYQPVRFKIGTSLENT